MITFAPHEITPEPKEAIYLDGELIGYVWPWHGQIVDCHGWQCHLNFGDLAIRGGMHGIDSTVDNDNPTKEGAIRAALKNCRRDIEILTKAADWLEGML